MKQIIKDSALSLQFAEQGFVVVPFLNAGQLQQLRDLFNTRCGEQAEAANGFFYSLLANNQNGNIEICNAIKNILQPCYDNFFTNYQSFAESFLAKGKSSGDMLLHQDWNYSDESEVFSATVWCPLQATTIANGTLFVIPGSHRYFKNYRSGTLPTARIVTDEKLAPYVIPVEVKPGQAVIFQQGLFHGSYPNQTSSIRTIVASIILEEGRAATYYNKESDSSAGIYHVSNNDFLAALPQLSAMQIPAGWKPAETVSYQHQHVTPDDLLQKIMSAVKVEV